MSAGHRAHSLTGLEVAVIGMAGSFSGAKNTEEFWTNLKDGVESIMHFSDEELEEHGIPSGLLKNPNYIKAGYGITDVEYFDASFFGYSSIDATLMDPQIRIFHEWVWGALEQAGYDPERYKEPIGVYAGAAPNRGWENAVIYSGIADILGGFAAELFIDKDFLSSHISYKLNLQGPSMTVFTACSTSLAVIHLACQGLLNGECGMAVAGAITAVYPPKQGYLYEEGMIVSPDGHCRSFDAKGRGTVFGTGGGVVVLKLLEEALADRDHIYAVIKGSALNNDGNEKAGYTAPSHQGQAVVIKTAQHVAEVEPESISYVEAHGTATELGDPIEMKALTSAFNTTQKGYCRIGSVKPNIGHLYTAAGMAGLIKASLALHHKMIPPSINFETPNPAIDFENSPFYVNTEYSEWKRNSHPRRAGVSSFAIGGTNGHLILEEAPVLPPSSKGRTWKMLLLSAKTAAALDNMAENLADYLKNNPEVNLADVAYTLQAGRAHFPYRRRVLCSTVEEAIASLSKRKEGDTTERVSGYMRSFLEDSRQSLIFMFTGQGAQYVEMGLELYQQEPLFRETIDRCAAILEPILKLDIRKIIYPAAAQKEEARKQILQTAMAQPLLFVLEYALATLLMNWGIRPYAMIGYSFGEYVAACLSGVFSLEDALELIAIRGRLMEQLPAGAMLSVPLSEKELTPLLNDNVSIAIVNGPSCIVAGSEEAIKAFEQKMKQQRCMCMRVTISLAAHCSEMDAIVKDFETHVRKKSLHPPKIPYISTITGEWIRPEHAADPWYWANHMKETVRFADGAERLSRELHDAVFLEIGPGRDLSILMSRFITKNPQTRIMNTIRHPQKEVSDMYFLLDHIAKLWGAGINLDWNAFYAHEVRYRVPLPTYPFERQRYWLDGTTESREPAASPPVTSLQVSTTPDVAEWFFVPSWKRLPLHAPERSSGQTCWLVFLDECGIGAQLVKHLKAEGHDVITVGTGAAFLKMNDREYVLNPQQHSDYVMLWQALLNRKMSPQTIVHLWGVENSCDFETLDIACLPFYSLLYLAQAIGTHEDDTPRQMIVITNNMQTVAGEGKLCPDKATVLGPCKVIPQEYPHIDCCSIDILLPQQESLQEKKLVHQLLMELMNRSENRISSDQIVAYRDSHRWVQAVEPIRLGDPGEGSSRLREKGVYMITGGLGGIGLALARYLAERVQAALILVDCLEFPAKEEREQWVTTHDEQESISQTVKTIWELEEIGSDVLILKADVSDYDQMHNVVTYVEKQYGTINGVIHAAGVLDRGMMQMKIREEVEKIFTPKVLGTIVLDRILQKKNLDFFILCSSLHPFVGGAGLSVSTAADSFLDAFALYKVSQGMIHTVSINWDLWQNVGMVVNAEKQGIRVLSKDSIVPQKGQEAFARVLEHSAPQVIISPRNIRSLAEQTSRFTIFDDTEAPQTGSSSSTAKTVRPELSAPYIPPQNEIEQAIVDIWQDFFGFDQIGIDDDFFELGGDSLKAIRIILRMRETFNTITLSLQEFFKAPTIAEMAEHVHYNTEQL